MERRNKSLIVVIKLTQKTYLSFKNTFSKVGKLKASASGGFGGFKL